MRAPYRFDPMTEDGDEWQRLYWPAPVEPPHPDFYESEPEPNGLLGPDGEPLPPPEKVPFGFQLPRKDKAE